MTSIEIMLLIIGYSAIALFIYIFFAFIVGTIKKNNAIMDIFYGPAYFVVALTSFILNLIFTSSFCIRQVIATTLVLIWAIRLASYVYIRNRGKPEDYRYKAMRERWKTNIALKSFFKIYLFQGIIVFLVGIPAWFINISENPPVVSLLDFGGITLWLGALIWLIGFTFETLADYSLYKFLQNPENAGKVMDKNVWKYSMHPNYFGEVTQWWGLFVLALAVPFGFITFIGPAYITFQIIKVSGVKLLDKRFEGNEEYAAYKKRTSLFIPWFPKKDKKKK
jgi:steroid 5-alpha reductase family enzyme